MDIKALAITLKIILSRLIRLDFVGINRLARVNTMFDADKITQNFVSIRSLFEFKDIDVDTSNPTPLPKTPQSLPKTLQWGDKSLSLADWQTQRSVCAMVVLKNGARAYEDYFNGTNTDDRRISWSMSKSVLSIAIGVLHDQGLLPPLDSKIGDLVPNLRQSAYANATLQNVLNMASGVAFNEDYLDFHSDINRLGRIIGIGGSMDKFAQNMTKQDWQPGAYNHYVSVDTHVLGMVVRHITGEPLADFIRKNVFDKLGMETAPYFVTDSFAEPFILGGLNLTTRDYARVGLMMAQGGEIGGNRIVSQDWITQSTQQSAPPPDPKRAAMVDGVLGYGYQWWLPPDAADGEYFAIGIYGQYIYIDTSRQVVIAINSADRDFKVGDGQITLNNLQFFRQIVAYLE
ncbi:MAG: serine hydrolase [Amylibacter sp.]|nr:serine hydrolase [Amylibacter sp.]